MHQHDTGTMALSMLHGDFQERNGTCMCIMVTALMCHMAKGNVGVIPQ